MGIPDVYWTWETKKAIKNTITEANEKEIKESVEKTRKVDNGWQEDRKVRDCLSYEPKKCKAVDKSQEQNDKRSEEKPIISTQK